MRRYAEIILAVVALCCLSGSTFYLFILGIDPTIDALELEQYEEQIRNFYLVSYIIVLLLTILNWRKMILGVIAIWPLMLLIAIAWLSNLWSVDPETTWRRDIALTITTLFGIYLFARWELPDALKILSIGLGILAIGSLILVIVMPEAGIHVNDDHAGAWRGLFVHKNFTGRVMLLTLAVLIAAWFAGGVNRMALVLLIAVTLLMALASQSKTTYVSMLAMVFAAIAVRVVRGAPLRSALATLSVLTVGWLLSVLIYSSYENILLALGRDATLTGRTELWAFVLRQLSGNWLLGFGYDAFWASDVGPGSRYKVDWGIDHAHNAWIEQVLNTGIFGAFLMLGICLVALYRAVILARYYPNVGPALLVSMVMFSLLTAGMSEPVFLEKHSITWIMIVLVVGCARALTAKSSEREEDAVSDPDPLGPPQLEPAGWYRA